MPHKENILKIIKEAKVSVHQINGLEEFNDDAEIAEALLERSGTYLKYLSDRFKDDKEIVTKAVQKHPGALTYASIRLQKSKELLRLLIDSPYALQPLNFIDRITEDDIWKQIVYKISNDDSVYFYTDDWINIFLKVNHKISQDELNKFDEIKKQDLILKVIKHLPFNILELTYITDPYIWFNVLMGNTSKIKFMPETVKKNIDIVQWRQLIIKDDNLYKYIPQSIVDKFSIDDWKEILQERPLLYSNKLPYTIMKNKEIFNLLFSKHHEIAINNTSDEILEQLNIKVKIIKRKIVRIEEECEIEIPAKILKTSEAYKIAEEFCNDSEYLVSSEDETDEEYEYDVISLEGCR